MGQSIKTEDGTLTPNLNEEHQRWKQWVGQNSYTPGNINLPEIINITEETLGRLGN